MNTIIRDSKFEIRDLGNKLQNTDWNLESMAIWNPNLESRIRSFMDLDDSGIVDA